MTTEREYVAKKQEETDEDVAPPRYDDAEEYRATKMLTGAGRVAYELWFVTATGKGELIVPIADKRIMEPPDDPHNEVAYIYFSSVSVAIHGQHLRRVLKDICTHRCLELRQIRPGQPRPAPGMPVIERFVFTDPTKRRKEEGQGMN
jgi:hypothetical protein